MRDRWFLFLAGMTIGTVVTVIIGVESRSFRCPEPSKPECVCKAEACPAVPAAVADMPPQVACPPQPTLEIRKPLSEELDAALATCKPALERALQQVREAAEAGYETMKTAQQLGVSVGSYDWLENADARKAATDLLGWRIPVSEKLTAVYAAERDCQRSMEDLLHQTEPWVWLDTEEVDDSIAVARGFLDQFYEFFDHDALYLFECNTVMRRLECPAQAESSEEETR